MGPVPVCSEGSDVSSKDVEGDLNIHCTRCLYIAKMS